MDFHPTPLNLYEQQPAFWIHDELPQHEQQPPSYLCEARRRTILDRVLNRPGELIWDEWIQTIDQWRALELKPCAMASPSPLTPRLPHDHTRLPVERAWAESLGNGRKPAYEPGPSLALRGVQAAPQGCRRRAVEPTPKQIILFLT